MRIQTELVFRTYTDHHADVDTCLGGLELKFMQAYQEACEDARIHPNEAEEVIITVFHSDTPAHVDAKIHNDDVFLRVTLPAIDDAAWVDWWRCHFVANNWIGQAMAVITGNSSHGIQMEFRDPRGTVESGFVLAVQEDGQHCLRNTEGRVVYANPSLELTVAQHKLFIEDAKNKWLQKARSSFLLKSIKDKDIQTVFNRMRDVSLEYPLVQFNHFKVL